VAEPVLLRPVFLHDAGQKDGLRQARGGLRRGGAVPLRSLSELEAVFHDGLPEDGPFLIDCRIGMDEMVFPMIPPGGSVKDMQLK
jgi:hypothetical protein